MLPVYVHSLFVFSVTLLKGQDKTKQSAAGKDAEMDLKENQSRQQPTNQSPTLLPLFPVPTQLSQRVK